MALATTAAMAQDAPLTPRGRIQNVGDYSQTSNAKARKIGSASSALLPVTGSPKVPVILAQFSNRTFTVAESDEALRENYEQFFNGGEGIMPGQQGAESYGSVQEYFRQQSDGQFTPQFTIIGPVTLSRGYDYYGQGTADIHINEFYSEACKQAVQNYNVDWNTFDNNNDGLIDLILFIYAGDGESEGTDVNTIWPKENPTQKTVIYDDTRVTFAAYACGPELYNGKQDGIGLCVHELGHGLGLPDLYDTGYKSFGMDFWDIMDSGCYQLTGHQPCCMTAYERDFMGWRQLVELDPDQSYTLTLEPIETTGVGYKVVNKANSNEYFILENRQNLGFDEYLPWVSLSRYRKYGHTHGLMITHIDYDRTAWNGNSVNTNANHQRLTIVPADGELVSSIFGYNDTWAQSLHGDLYPGPDNVTEMSSYAVFTGTTLGQTIDNIRETSDGLIILDINGGDPDAILSATETPATIEAIYSPEGQPRQQLQRGLNLVRYSDHSVRKVLR